MTAALMLAEDDLRTIIEETWSSLFADVPSPVDGLTLGGDGVSARVGITGSWSGEVLVETSVSGAVALTAALLALPFELVEPLDLEDAVGELANIVGGSVKSCVDGDATLSLPRVTRLPALSQTLSRTSMVVTALWDEHPLRVIVRESPTPPGAQP